MIQYNRSDVAKGISDLKATESESELRQNVPVELVEEWLQETDADPTQYEWLQNVEK